VKDEIGERLNRVVPVGVAVTIRCKSGCGGLLGVIPCVFAGAQHLRSILLRNVFFSDTLLSLSHSRTYIYLSFQFNLEKNLI
jgi:hypothetical protein